MPLSTLRCDQAPGPDTCVSCLEAFQDYGNVDCIQNLFSGSRPGCSIQYPQKDQVNISSSGACTNCVDLSNHCRRVPVIMRGDAYDLQDLIKFTVTSIECIVLYPDVEKPNNSIATLKKSLIRIVANLIEEFVKAVDIAELSVKNRSADDLRNHIRHLQMLAAARHPFPKKGDWDQEDLLDWQKRSELRLLPGDDGFSHWRTAKALFRANARQFLCDPTVQELGQERLEEYDLIGDSEYEDMANGFLDTCCPFNQ